MWLKADNLRELADGSPVTRWLDASGNAMDCAQEEATKRPRWIENAIGGQPALRFDGVDDHLLLDHYPGLFHTFYKSTIFVVVRPSDGGTIISQGHTNLSITPGASSRFVYSSAFGAANGEYIWPQLQSTNSGSLESNRPVICTMVHAGDGKGATSLHINGVRKDSGEAFPYHKTSPIAAYLGCAYRQRNPWKGDIAEVIIYGQALADPQRQSIERYLSDKYETDLVHPAKD